MTFGRAVAIAAGLTVLMTDWPAMAQNNLDAGRTPAQMFANTCSACHRRPQELKRTSASFLRSHYMTAGAEAEAMSRYLAGIPSDPKAVQKRTPPGSVPAVAGRPGGGEGAPEQPKDRRRAVTKADPKGEPKADVRLEPKAEPKAEPRPEPKFIEPRTEPKAAETGIDPKSEPKNPAPVAAVTAPAAEVVAPLQHDPPTPIREPAPPPVAVPSAPPPITARAHRPPLEEFEE